MQRAPRARRRRRRGHEELLDLHARALTRRALARPKRRAMLRKAAPTRCAARRWRCSWTAYLDLEQPERAAEVSLAPPRARVGVELMVARARLARRARARLGRRGLRAGGARAPARAARAARVEGGGVRPSSAARSTSRARSAALRSLKTATELDPRMARAWYYAWARRRAICLADGERARRWSGGQGRSARSPRRCYYLGRMRAALADPTAKERTRVPRGGAEGAVRRRGARRAQAAGARRRLRRPVLRLESVAGDGERQRAVDG